MRELLHKDWLDSHINLEAKAGKIEGVSLDRAKLLAELLGNPQNQYRAAHITGTNGKGSTASILTNLLVALGFKVGTYVSPHVVSINERIQFNGLQISDKELDNALERTKEVEEKSENRFTWFEIMTTTAFNWFLEKNIDIAVVEIGKLGRFDATNIINAEVCVITNISKDHTDGEGEWEKTIAWEKAGIIKPGSSLISGVTKPEIKEILEAENPVASYYLEQDLHCTKNEKTNGGRIVSIKTNIMKSLEFDDIFLSLHGAHQGMNATLALGAAQALLKKKELPPKVVSQVFSEVGLAGRFEILLDDPLVIVDGGHNPAGTSIARQTLDDYLTEVDTGNGQISNGKIDKAKNSTLIFGLTVEKPITEMLQALNAETFTRVICTNLPTHRTRDFKELDKVAKELGLNSTAIEDPAEALRVGMDSELVFACGSLYLAGAIKRAFNSLQSNVKVSA